VRKRQSIDLGVGLSNYVRVAETAMGKGKEETSKHTTTTSISYEGVFIHDTHTQHYISIM